MDAMFLPFEEGVLDAADPEVPSPSVRTSPAVVMDSRTKQRRDVDKALAAVGECVVCMDGVASHLVVPCGHQCLCTSCASLVETCPVCRGAVSQTIRVFASGCQLNSRKKRKQKDGYDADVHHRKGEKKERRRNIASTQRTADSIDTSAASTLEETAALETSEPYLESGEQTDTPDFLNLVAPFQAVLDDPNSTDLQMYWALEDLRVLHLKPSVDSLRQSRIGHSVNAIAKSRSRGDNVRKKAETIVNAWKKCIHATSDKSERQGSSEDAQAHGEGTSESSNSRRDPIEVLVVNFGARAKRRLQRHAARARIQGESEALVVEDCVQVESDSNDLSGSDAPSND